MGGDYQDSRSGVKGVMASHNEFSGTVQIVQMYTDGGARWLESARWAARSVCVCVCTGASLVPPLENMAQSCDRVTSGPFRASSQPTLIDLTHY